MSMPMFPGDPNVRTVKPDGLPLAILVLSIVFLSLSIITVTARTYIRIVKGAFGFDDAFMVAGCVAYTAATGLAVHDVFIGLGRVDADLNDWQHMHAMKYYIIWILTYVLALATVKSSICMTILRIASTKMNLRIAVYVLLAVTWASFFITFIGTLLYCKPVSAIWDIQLLLSGKATCAPVETFVIIGHTATVSTIFTDLALVVVPAIILWNTQMKRQAKLQAFGLLSFASVASIITMVRIPYVNKFSGGTNLPFWVAHIMLCSNIETGIGCVASSVPSLRHYLRQNASSTDSRGLSQKQKSGLNSTSQHRVRSKPRAEDNWEELQDGNSDRSVALLNSRGIHKEQTFEVDIEMQGFEKSNDGIAPRH